MDWMRTKTKPPSSSFFLVATRQHREGCPLETITFETAMRRLLADWAWNFKDFRKALRDDSGPVVANYDGAFAVEGALDAYVHLLDYAVPVARLELYDGSDEAVADMVSAIYSERLAAFATAPSEPGCIEYPPTDADPNRRRWAWLSYPTEGPVIYVYRYDVRDAAETVRRCTVYVEVPGLAVECIKGSPDDSVWRILLGDE